MNRTLGTLLVLLALALPAPATLGAPPAAAVLPGDSLYQLDVRLDPAGGGALAWSSLAGRPVVVALFYSSCTVMCPMLTHAMQRLEHDLAAGSTARFVMISLDDEHDTPEHLAAFARKEGLAPDRWLIAHASRADVRTLAAALGVRYRRLPDGSYSHSTVITLLDRDGRRLAATEQVAGEDAAFLARLNALGD